MSGARAWLALALGLAVGGALVGFALSNEAVVEVSFLRWRLREGAPLWVVAGAAALAGFMARSALSLVGDLRRWRERRALRRRVAALEQEVVRLRNLPLRDLPPLTPNKPAAQPSPLSAPSPTLAAHAEGARASSPPALVEPELLPREDSPRADPYGALFADADALAEAWDEGALYPAVRGARKEGRP
jgi:uncharacterized integral membrane protein